MLKSCSFFGILFFDVKLGDRTNVSIFESEASVSDMSLNNLSFEHFDIFDCVFHLYLKSIEYRKLSLNFVDDEIDLHHKYEVVSWIGVH